MANTQISNNTKKKHKYTNTQISNNARKHKYTNTQISNNTKKRKYKFATMILSVK